MKKAIGILGLSVMLAAALFAKDDKKMKINESLFRTPGYIEKVLKAYNFELKEQTIATENPDYIKQDKKALYDKVKKCFDSKEAFPGVAAVDIYKNENGDIAILMDNKDYTDSQAKYYSFYIDGKFYSRTNFEVLDGNRFLATMYEPHKELYNGTKSGNWELTAYGKAIWEFYILNFRGARRVIQSDIVDFPDYVKQKDAEIDSLLGYMINTYGDDLMKESSMKDFAKRAKEILGKYANIK